MNTTNVSIVQTKPTQLSIQLLIITGYTTLSYVYTNDINLPLVLSTIMYMIIY